MIAPRADHRGARRYSAQTVMSCYVQGLRAALGYCANELAMRRRGLAEKPTLREIDEGNLTHTMQTMMPSAEHEGEERDGE